MIPTENWLKDCRCGLDPNLEKRVSEELVEIFQAFWDWANLDTRSRTTQQTYSGAPHALGGYLVEEVGNGVQFPETTQEFLRAYIDSGDGPLVHHDNEAWQNDLDRVCRKLYRYIDTQC
jgi:hypothetical protein